MCQTQQACECHQRRFRSRGAERTGRGTVHDHADVRRGVHMDYDKLWEEYPEVISMDQFYRICQISKRKARWILENGVVPCRDSGKKTRRFQIRLEDVIAFLRKRDEGLLEGVIPVGGFSSKSAADGRPRYDLDSDELCSFLVAQWQDEPDMLTSRHAAALCGYNMYTINRWAQDRLVKAVLYYGKYLISKDSPAEYLSSGGRARHHGDVGATSKSAGGAFRPATKQCHGVRFHGTVRV